MTLSTPEVPATTLLLEVLNVTKRFEQVGQGVAVALRSVSLRVHRGEFLVVVGHNGSGKSTLVNLIAGDLTPSEGSIRLGVGADGRSTPRMARVRQNPVDGTFADLTVLENFQIFGFARRPSPLRSRVTAAIETYARQRLASYGIAEKMKHRMADLSQGQRQLLALELAMSRSPDLLLLDEHTASLDRANAAACMDATLTLVRKCDTAVVMITHNFAEALRYGDVLIVLRDGQIACRMSGEAKARLTLTELMGYSGLNR